MNADAMRDSADHLRKHEKENPRQPGYVCTYCAARGFDIVCDRCHGDCVPLGETPNARADRLNVEGLA